MSRAEKQVFLGKVTDECKLSGDTLRLRGDEMVQFQPTPEASYESVDCALNKLKPVVGLGKMGFVGNEAYSNESK